MDVCALVCVGGFGGCVCVCVCVVWGSVCVCVCVFGGWLGVRPSVHPSKEQVKNKDRSG